MANAIMVDGAGALCSTLSSRQRASHTKSKQGCDNCRRRHQKCDEQWPSCGRCRRLHTPCQRPDAAMPSRAVQPFRGFRIVTPIHLRHATMPNVEDVNAFECFHFLVLPLMRRSPTAPLWGPTAGYLSQTSSAVRKVMVALGSQQRLSVGRASGTVTPHLVAKAESSYNDAARALRQCIATRSNNKLLIVAFACVLFAMLEALRGSSREILIHLHYGSRVFSEMDLSLEEAAETGAIALFIHEFCVSIWLQCHSVAYQGDYKPLVAEIVKDFGAHTELRHPDSLFFKHSCIVRDTIQTLTQIDREIDQEWWTKVYRIAARIKKLQGDIEQLRSRENGNGEDVDLLTAKASLSQVLVNSALGVSRLDCSAGIRCFATVVDHLERFLTRLNQAENVMFDRSCSFSFGFGILEMLDIVLTKCPNYSIRSKAFELLDLCSSRDGTWVAEDVKKTCKELLGVEESSERLESSAQP